MATNYVQPGDVLQITSDYTKTSGQPIRKGKLIGVCLEAISAAGTGSVATEGVYDLTVSTTGTVGIGDPLYLATSGVNITDVTGSNNTLFGYALEAITSAISSAINVFIARV